jgi:hypothetical protein
LRAPSNSVQGRRRRMPEPSEPDRLRSPRAGCGLGLLDERVRHGVEQRAHAHDPRYMVPPHEEAQAPVPATHCPSRLPACSRMTSRPTAP